MLLRIEELKDACAKILNAVDSNSLSTITETLELKSEKDKLYLRVTNREYLTEIALNISEPVSFHATINANLFLKLVAQTTSETIELTVDDTNLNVIGNGKYKLPLIYEQDHLLELPNIEIYNSTASFEIPTSILHSLITYNSKEISKGGISKPVQKLYYIDDKGCITFSTGACVNNFTLNKPIKILINDRLVKLFKLFKEDKVLFTLGYDALSDEIIQTKVKFESQDIKITSIISCDDSLISSVPVTAIRNRANNTYSYLVVFNKNELLEAINRLLLFNDKSPKFYGIFEFTEDEVTIWDSGKNNNEIVYYETHLNNLEHKTYSAILDFNDLKITLDGCTEQYINFNFGDEQAVVISRKNIYNVIPECRIS